MESNNFKSTYSTGGFGGDGGKIKGISLEGIPLYL